MKSKTTTFEKDLKDITESRFFFLEKTVCKDLFQTASSSFIQFFFYLQDYKKPSINASKPRVNQVKNNKIFKKIKKPRELE